MRSWRAARASVSAADFGSLKASAAVLLSAMMRASAERSRRRYPRNSIESARTMPNPASSSAAVVVTMMMITSFCLIGLSRKVASSIESSRSYFSTDLATLSSLELSFSPAFSAAA